MAAVSWASSNRLATLALNRVIGTRLSILSPATGTSTGVDTALVTCICPSAAATAFNTSSFVTRLPLPVPTMLVTSSFCSSAIFRAAGLALAVASSKLSTSGVSVMVSRSASVAFSATSPASNIASTSSASTVSPSAFRISVTLPSDGATTSRTTLSVSISTRI